MPNNNYRKGRSFEYRVKKYFESIGYYVIRAASSKGAFDLVAVNMTCSDLSEGDFTNILLIQCKYGAKISKKERDQLKVLQARLQSNASIIIAWSKPRQSMTFFKWKLRWIPIFDDEGEQEGITTEYYYGEVGYDR